MYFGYKEPCPVIATLSENLLKLLVGNRSSIKLIHLCGCYSYTKAAALHANLYTLSGDHFYNNNLHKYTKKFSRTLADQYKVLKQAGVEHIIKSQ